MERNENDTDPGLTSKPIISILCRKNQLKIRSSLEPGDQIESCCKYPDKMCYGGLDPSYSKCGPRSAVCMSPRNLSHVQNLRLHSPPVESQSVFTRPTGEVEFQKCGYWGIWPQQASAGVLAMWGDYTLYEPDLSSSPSPLAFLSPVSTPQLRLEKLHQPPASLRCLPARPRS